MRTIPIMRVLAGVAFVGSAAAAAPAAVPGPRDAVLDALLLGDSAGAQRARAAARGLDPAAAAALDCRLGRALLAGGELDAAGAALARVPADAPCAGAAAFDRAALLAARGDQAAADAALAAAAAARLGPGRQDVLLGILDALARQVEADPDLDDTAALRLRALQVELALDPTRRRAAAEAFFAAWDAAGAPAGATSTAAVEALVGARVAGQTDDPTWTADLRRLLPALPPAARAGRPLGATDPADLRAWVRAPAPAATVLAWRERLAAADPAGESLAEGVARAEGLAAAGRAAEADALFAALEPRLVDPAARAEARRARARLARERGDFAAAAAHGEALTALAGNPARAADRAAALADARHAVDAAAAAGDLAAARAGGAAVAALGGEAGDLVVQAVLATRAGDAAAARRLAEEALGRAGADAGTVWAALGLLARADPAGPIAHLRAVEAANRPWSDAAEGLRLSLGAPALWIDGGAAAPGAARVRVRARAVDRLELRVHRIDPEALLRAGGGVADLEALDTAVVAPDRAQAVPVPALPPGVIEADLDLPLPGLAPGFYAVTAAAPTTEARALVVVGAVQARLRASGPEALVAVEDAAGRPLRGARVFVRAGDGLVDGRTDAAGVFRVRAPGALAAVVVDRAGVAFLDGVEAGVPAAAAGRAAGARFDRPVVRPGDTVQVLVETTVDGRPAPGRWSLWWRAQVARPGPGGVDLAEVVLPALPAEAGPDGRFVAALPGPASAGWADSRGPWSLQATLMGQPEGEAARVLGSVRVVPEDPGVQLAADRDGDQLRAVATDAGGAPVAGLPVIATLRFPSLGFGPVERRLGLTGADGQATATAGLPGLAWTATLHTPFAGARPVAAAASPPLAPPPAPLLAPLRAPGDPLDPSPFLRPGDTLVLERGAPAPAPPPAVPLDPDPQPRFAPPARPEEGPPAGATWAPVAAAPAPLVPDAPGPWRLRRVAADGTVDTFPFTVAPPAAAPRWEGAAPLRPGSPFPGRLRGGPALVTLEQDGFVWVRRLADGEGLPPVPALPSGHARLVVSAPGQDAVAWELPVEADLSVDLDAQPAGDALAVAATVRHPDGRPAAGARVLVRVVDRALVDHPDAPEGLSAPAADPGPAAAVRTQPLVHRAVGQLVSEALLDEARRAAEADLAAAVARGALPTDPSAFDLLELDGGVIGGFSAGGMGGGIGGSASGYGSGSGTLLGGLDRAGRPRPGHREALAFAVLTADASGVVRLRAPLPPRAATWLVRAVAWTDGPATARARAVAAPAGPAAVPAPAAPADPALAPDPLAAADLGRAARAGLAAATVTGPAADAALRRALHQVLELGEPPDAPSARDRARLLATAAARGIPLPVGLVDRAFDDAFAAVDHPDDLAFALAAAADAGHRVEPALHDRLDRAAARLSPAARAAAARAARAAGRPAPAGPLDGPDAVLLALATGAPPPPGPLLLPPVGDPARPTALAARAAAAAAGVPLATAEAPPAAGAAPAPAHPLPAGRLRRPFTEVDPLGPPLCATAAPCAVPLHGALRFAVAPGPGFHGAGLLEPTPDPRVWRAVAPGTARLTGLRTAAADGAPPRPAAPFDLHVLPADAPLPPLDPAHQQALAAEIAAAGGDPRPLLPAAPEAWPTPLRAPLAALRFAAVRAHAPADAEALLDAFDEWRAADPAAPLDLDAVADVARALSATGRLDRARAAWLAALTLSFRAEAAAIGRLEPVVGPLRTIGALRDAADRAPALPAVASVLYALPGRLRAQAAGGLSPTQRAAGLSPTALRLHALDLDRELLVTFPDAPEARGAALATLADLVDLGAPARAARQAAAFAAADPAHPDRDALLLLEGLAWADAGAHPRALALLAQVSTVPSPDGGANALGDAAALGAARIHEAAGRLDAARALYARSTLPAAAAAAAALDRRSLALPPLVRLDAAGPATLPVTARNLDRLALRATPLDLRTLFVRDGGLPDPDTLVVSGVGQVIAVDRPLRAGTFPTTVPVDLPLRGPGAWLVEATGGGHTVRALVVRSPLALHVDPGGRAEVRDPRGQPAANVELRAFHGGRLVATRTDLRGVATLPAGVPAIAFRPGDTAPTVFLPDTALARAEDPPAPAASPDLLGPVRARAGRQDDDTSRSYEDLLEAGAGTVELQTL